MSGEGPSQSGANGEPAATAAGPGAPEAPAAPAGAEAEAEAGEGAGRPPLLTAGRRGFLAGAGATTLAFWVQGRVAGEDPPLQVATLWSGTELDAFARIVRDFDPAANVTGHGDGIDAFIRRRATTRNQPDVAILSRPGLVREYARNGWLEPLPSFLADRYDRWWNDLVTAPGVGGGALYGAWVKMAYKSSFWYRPSLVDTSLVEGQGPQEWTWGRLQDWAFAQADLALRGEAAPPFSLGAMDAWVLTDWFENVLATVTEPDEYAALATGRAPWDQANVRDALREVGELWRTPGMIAGGAAARSIEFEGAVRHLVDGRAAMVFEGDFVGAYVDFYRRDDDTWEEPGVFAFPPHNQVSPVVLGGDVAVARKGSRRGVDLIEYLTDEAVVRTWQRQPGYLTFNTHADVTQYSDRIAEYIGTVVGPHGELNDADDQRFDLSDQLPAALTGAAGQGSWSIMAEFLDNLTSGDRNLELAVDRAVTRFEDGG